MGDGQWEMGNGRWEILSGKVHVTVGSPSADCRLTVGKDRERTRFFDNLTTIHLKTRNLIKID